MLDEFTARNNDALTDLVERHGVKLRRLPDDVLRALAAESEAAMQRLVSSDPLAARVYDSFSAFRAGVKSYHNISEQAFLEARELAETD